MDETMSKPSKNESSSEDRIAELLKLAEQTLPALAQRVTILEEDAGQAALREATEARAEVLPGKRANAFVTAERDKLLSMMAMLEWLLFGRNYQPPRDQARRRSNLEEQVRAQVQARSLFEEQRTALRAERDQAIAERDQAIAERDAARKDIVSIRADHDARRTKMENEVQKIIDAWKEETRKRNEQLPRS
jgi:hypothetical protein